MKKDLSIIGGLFLVVIGIIVFSRFFGTSGLMIGTGGGQATQAATVNRDSTSVKINQLDVEAKIAATSKDRQVGLSKYESLPLDQGMLFIFDKQDTYAIWMKGMKFAIDIIWLDSDKKVVDIAQNVAPEPGKKDTELTIYRPNGQAKYILEINAGLSSVSNVDIGDIADFAL